MLRENRNLRGVIAALRQRIDDEAKADLDRASQLVMLREANQHLVLATFSASDQHAEAALANERQTVFLSLLAHELRNPIASITFANTIMGKMDGRSVKLNKLIGIVGRQSMHLVRLVDDLLDVSRVRTGKLTLQFHDGMLTEVLEGAIASVQHHIDQRTQVVQLDLPAEGVRLHADHIRLVQLFSNLLVNASKFSPPATILHIAAVVRGPVVAVTIRDEGKGIAGEDLERMSELFEQGPEESLHSSSGGLGIGLSLVRSIATMHGGSVSVNSAGSGQGSEFVVILPLVATAAPRVPAAQLVPEPRRKVL